ncbi:MAG TPA: hotdog domain-containing protein [Jatrophihabitans sp.]
MHYFVLDAARRPELDGTVWTDGHLRFYEALETVGLTWALILEKTGRGDLSLEHMAVVNVTADFRHEMFVGRLEIDAALERIGTTSVTLVCSVAQGGNDVGTVRAVLVKVGDGRVDSLPFTEDQRAALATLQPAISGE